MSILARAGGPAVEAACRALPPLPAYRLLRAPETGLVMVRGRAGGSGAPFNVGEMTVTRCSVTLEDGRVGHAYVPGRDTDHAERAAVLDALLLDEHARPSLERAVIAPLEAAQAARDHGRRARVAGTRVEFFTMVRGEEE
jgi:alpha-D-ribose 1-methylphosphonate 5-triphosphate synthase subunit PhnG